MLIYLAMVEGAEEKLKFEQLYEKYRNLMYHVAYQILGSHQDAEDAVHQAFLAIIQNFEKISLVECPKTRSFVVIITERKAIDQLRYRNRHRAEEFDEQFCGLAFPAPTEDPLAEAMAKLPAQYREALLLRYDNGFTAREIAVFLGISESGVRKLLGRAKKELQKILKEEGVEL